MSLALFNSVPAGAIETVFDDQNQPWFKRADLGRYLGIVDIARNFKDKNYAKAGNSPYPLENVKIRMMLLSI